MSGVESVGYLSRDRQRVIYWNAAGPHPRSLRLDSLPLDSLPLARRGRRVLRSLGPWFPRSLGPEVDGA